jgi:Holliday junction resolvasome RuvABC endonuclease subunit
MTNLYTWALDISLINTGVALFDENGVCVETFSLPTSGKEQNSARLYRIYRQLIELQLTRPAKRVIMERGFSRFNIATQSIFRVHGVVNLAFWDKEQIYYPPKVIKLALLKGDATKEQLRKIINTEFPLLKPKNDDESDAIAIGLCYFKKMKESSDKDECAKINSE